MNKAELADLREAWVRDVVLDFSMHGGGRPAKCWFASHPESAKFVIAEAMGWGPCEGRLEGAHWIKRQAVEEQIKRQYGPFVDDIARAEPREWEEVRDELIALAAWDPRNGVPACERHHRHFDGQLVDASAEFVVYRPFVPLHVEEFVADFGLESRLEQKCPDLPADWADV